MSEIVQSIGKVIRSAREGKGLTQKELGERLGIGEPTVSKYESGKQNLTVDTLERVANALDMHVKITFY